MMKGGWALAQSVLTILMHLVGACLIGIGLIPTVVIISVAFEWTIGMEDFAPKAVILALALGLGYIAYCYSIVLVIGGLRFLLRLRLTPGEPAMLSGSGIKWGFLSALHQIVRATALMFLVPTIIGNMYYRLMGAKIGKGVQINTQILHDATLVTIEDYAVIGGGASINGHIIERRHLILAPVHIGPKSTIGTGCLIMPGVTVGEGAIVAARSVVPKHTIIGDYEIWGGMPAVKIGERTPRTKKERIPVATSNTSEE